MEVKSRVSSTQVRSFGDLLREFRVTAGLTQEALAERARMSVAAVSKLERGTRQRPYRATVALLADALSLSSNERFELERAAHCTRAVSEEERDVDSTIILPLYFSSFVGRRQDLDQVCDMVAKHRLVTLVGAGGVGKTRLAVRVAEQFIAASPETQHIDGVWFVDFAPLNDDAMLVTALASAIGVGQCRTIDALIRYLCSQTFLLVLDNCEHLLDSIAHAAKAIISGCPHARILATSRQALSLEGERIHHVPPLSFPSRETLSANDALEFDAIQLFKDRAEAADSRFELSDSIAPSVAEICQRVDGIALAIELAAARTSAFSPASIARQIKEQLAVLARGVRTSLPRHQTMRALFDWSYDLLDESERELFRRCSIFASGFTLDLVCDAYATHNERAEVPSTLASLVDKSLAQCDTLVEPTRYRLLEPARQYAREKLRERGEYDGSARSHVLALLTLAEDFDSKLELISDRVWDAYIERERENFRAAFEWALSPDGDASLALRLAASRTATFSGFRSGEARKWMRAALDNLSETTPPQILAKLAIAEARTNVIFGPSQHAENSSEASVDACQRALTLQPEDDLAALATAQFWLGAALQNMGRHDEADNALREARVTARSAGAQNQYNMATVALCGSRYGAGDLQEARELISEALKQSEEAGCDRLAAEARAYLAEIEFASGSVERALMLTEKTTQFFRSHSNLLGLSMTLSNSAAYLIVLEHYQEAREVARETLQRSRVIGNMRSTLDAMQHLAAIAVLSGTISDNDGAAFQCAASVLGFVDETREQIGTTCYHTERQERDKMLAVLTHVLGKERLVTLMTSGKEWTEEQAIAEALAL